MSNKHPAHRDSVFIEDATVISHERFDADQYILRLASERCAERAEPGCFSHLQCSQNLPMRRPLSIMRTDKQQGWVEYLYRDVGLGTHALAQRKVGESISVMGPIGQPFIASANKSRPLLIGGGVGIPPMIFLAEQLKQQNTPGGQDTTPLVLMGSEVPYPFATQPSSFTVAGLDNKTSHSINFLEKLGIASRLASLQNYEGCFQGYVTDLGRAYLAALSQQGLAEVEIFSCGPQPMLQACARLAEEFSLDCQVSLEEYMACAVGGCAGCVVAIHTDDGPAMKRVCVDGPVFNAKQVYPEIYAP
ncbi:MAG: dihydroorotate dehydrogenase electron transfer subunit [Gammaproteobacteria bacterium]|nr:dihydroorotate dehydrogenase electron transfer subunit [Gammaproteobacteria bacterium]